MMNRRCNRKTECARCRYQGPRVHVNGAVYATCLRHRMDGEPHALPQEWLDAMDFEEVRCDLFQPAMRRAA